MSADNTSLGEFMGRMSASMDATTRSLQEVNAKLDALPDTYVTQDAFRPVRNIAYGAVTFLCVTVAGGLVVVLVGLAIKFLRTS